MIKIIKNSKLDNEKLDGCLPIVTESKLKGFDFSNVIVKKPWGYEYLAYSGREVSVWILKINKGAVTSMHCHPNKKTALILLFGEAISSTLKNNFRLKEGDGLLLDKKVFHSTKAISDYIFVMEAEIPPIKTDLVRLQDKYGRESKGYEQQNEMCFNFGKYKPVFFSELEEKKIGKMLISVKNFQDNLSLQSDLDSFRGIALLLSGKLFNSKSKKYFDVGDTFEINNPGTAKNIKMEKPIKILKIARNKKVKAILFDFDGVLADTMEDNFLAWERAFKNFEVDIKKNDYFPLEGMKLAEIAKEISDKYKIHPNPQTLVKLKNNYYLKNHSLKFYPKVDKLIDSFKKNRYLLAIVSASPREKLNKTVSKGFLKKFDVIISEEDSKNGKPNPEPYLNAAKKLGILPEECIVVENAPLGIKSAKTAGMYCIAICTTLDKSFLYGADKIIHKFEELNKFI